MQQHINAEGIVFDFYTTSVSQRDSQKAYEKFFANKGGSLAKAPAKKKVSTTKEDGVIRQE